MPTVVVLSVKSSMLCPQVAPLVKLQDRGSGQYSVSLIAPDSNATSVTVVVQSASGDLRKELEVEIVGGSASTAVAVAVTDDVQDRTQSETETSS